MKKNVIYILTTLLIVSLATFIVLYSQKYSMVDVDADNFGEILTRSYGSSLGDNVFYGGAQRLFREDEGMLLIKGVTGAENFTISYDENDRKTLHAYFKNTLKNVRYEIVWKNKDFNDIEAEFFLVNTVNGYSQEIREGITNLILKEGFVLKKSNYINGDDIIIKETPSSFIIGEIMPKFDGPNGVIGVMFMAFGKRKYFKSF